MTLDSSRLASILLVDDRPQDLAVLSSILAHPDYRLVTARSGMEALRRVLERDFAVILLDVRMPGMDGFEVASAIKSRDRSRHTPILFLTAAHEDVSTIYRAYSVGAVDYLAKPLDEAVVRAKVGIFVELFRKDQRIQEQARALKEASQRERELQLAEVRLLSEKRYRSLMEMIPAAVWTASADGTVTYCNHRWYEVTGMHLEDRGPRQGQRQKQSQGQSQGWLAAVHPADAQRVATQWSAAMAAGETYSSELRLMHTDGSSRWYLCHIIPESEPRGGRAPVRGWLGMFADCEELKHAVEARDEFMSIASHELRTPLSTLLLNLEGLRRQLVTEELDERARRKLESALRQTHRMEKLVSSLLDVARIVAGRFQLEPEACDLVEIVQQAVNGLRPQAVAVGCALELCDPGQTQIMGRWDRMRLEQVVINLVSNAIKYGAGKPIHVSLECPSDPEAGPVAIRVRDQGIGIATEHLGRIFDRFERAASKNYSGLGMGLYISRQIVEAHGGAMAVASEVGRGSTFTVTLPLRR
ncbi:MAG TPA: ATP-binding protein [Polyangia bacterium]|nr:ATP-binding protein [Polyangia bacterium]